MPIIQDMRAFLRVDKSEISMFSKTAASHFGADTLIEHIDGLYSYALVLTRNPGDAEDLVQETYLRAIPAMERLRKDSNIKSWLFTILRNTHLNQIKHSRLP